MGNSRRYDLRPDNVPAAVATALGLLCLAIVVVGGAHPLITRPNWRWSWESPPLAFVGYMLAAAAVAGAARTAWLSLRTGRWVHVGLAALFVVSAAVAILLLWRSGAWLSDFRAELLPDQ